MPDYELHADYDRDGRLTASAAEYALRGRAPGAILVPNADADARRLPERVTAGPRVMLDGRQPVAPDGDDEQLPLQVMVRRASAAPGTRFFLRPLGFARVRIRVNDSAGRILPRDPVRGDDLPIALPSRPGVLSLRLSTATLAGSPAGHVTDLNGRFRVDPTDEASFRLQLIAVDPAGRERVLDEGRFTVAPFLLPGPDAPAVRMYVADLGDDPSNTELAAALADTGVPLLRVPQEARGQDTWLQDQFQPGLLPGADGWRQLLLHLPRARADTANGTAAANLAQLVVSHFPSRNLGVFDDLWQRSLAVLDAGRVRREIRFADCLRLALDMDQVPRLAARFYEEITAVDPAAAGALDAQWPAQWSDEFAWLPLLLQRLQRAAREHAGGAEWAETMRLKTEDLRTRLAALAGRLRLDRTADTVLLPLASGALTVSMQTANRLYRRLSQMRDSSNYGGNIEGMPASADAPLGSVVVGNRVMTDGSNDWDFMDPDLLRVLYAQRLQTVVQIDTSWLHVGHVDEVMACVPGGGGGFALLQASPAFALALLRGARARYLAGLSPADRAAWTDEPSGILDRNMVRGSAPVTRLMRGKLWTHFHAPVTSADQLPNIVEPPQIYQRLAQAMVGGVPGLPTSGINLYGIRYWPGPGPQRFYPANITVAELLYCEKDNAGASTNDALASGRVQSITDMLTATFDRVPRLPLPVLFDRVPQAASARLRTSAFTPNSVNLQVIGRRLLVPRPYGPRMRLADAAAVIVEALRALELPASIGRRVDAAFLRRHALGTGVYWLQRQPRLDRPFGSAAPYSGTFATTAMFDGLMTEADVIKEFEDSFAGADAATLRQRIIDPNRAHFDANHELRTGWRRFVIDDGLVDLFEATILAVADELGLQVRWVDSWFHHQRTGEIHCGTNVLRTAGSALDRAAVWSALAAVAGAATAAAAPAPA